MKKYLLSLFLLLITFSLQAQVHVRGYYRKNGTYVQPHERTRPNNTVTDNYSYPGNYNPNRGTTTSGSSGGSDSGNGIGNTNSETTSPRSQRSGANPVITWAPGAYRIDSSISPPLRQSPSLDSREIYSCPQRATVQVLEDAGPIFCKALVNGHVGYISKRLLVQTEPFQPTSTVEPTANLHQPQALSAVGKALYKTSFDVPFAPALRDAPSITGKEIYTCSTTAKVYVLEELEGTYLKVYVDGYVGYVAKTFLVKR